MVDTSNAAGANLTHKKSKPPTFNGKATRAAMSGLNASIVYQKSNADLSRAAERLMESHEKLTELKRPVLAHGEIEEIDSTPIEISSSQTSQADPLSELVEKFAIVDVEYKKALEQCSGRKNKPDATADQIQRVGRLLLQQEVVFSSAETDLVQQIKTTEKKLAEKSNLVMELEALKQSSDAELDGIVRERAKQNQNYREAISHLEQKVLRRNFQIERLKREKDTKESDCLKLRTEHNEIEELERRSSEKVTALEKQMLNLRESYNKLRDDLDGLTSKYECSALTEKSLQTDLQISVSERDDWQKRYHTVKAELECLKGKEKNAVDEAKVMSDNIGKQVEQRIIDEQGWATENCNAEWISHLHEACGTSTDTSCWIIEKLWNAMPRIGIRSVPLDIRRLRLEISTVFTFKPRRCTKDINATTKKRALKILLCLTHGDVPRLWEYLHQIYELWYIWEDSSLLDDTRIMLFPLLWGIVFKAVTMRGLREIRGVLLWLMLQLGCSLLRYSKDPCRVEDLMAKVYNLQKSPDILLSAAALRFDTINKQLMTGSELSVLEDPSLYRFCQSLDSGADEAVTLMARELGKTEAIAICILTYRGLDFHVEVEDEGHPFFWHGDSNGVAFFVGFDLVPWFALADDERCWEIVQGGGHALRAWASRYDLWLTKCPEKFVELLQNRMNID